MNKKSIKFLLVLLICLQIPLGGDANEMSSSDKFALLYTPQFNFTQGGDPMIRLGITSGKEQITFIAEDKIKVMPMGVNGPSLILPAGETYTVTIKKGTPGIYKYWVVLEELPPTDPELITQTEKNWKDKGLSINTIEVGSIFAISGRLFDNRVVMLTTGGFDSEQKAIKTLRELADQYDLSPRIHTEITRFPSGILELTGTAQQFVLNNPNLLWIYPSGDNPIEIKDVTFGERTQKSGTETRKYSGALLFVPDRDGKLSLINQIRAEKMLYGVVPSEIYSSAPMESLKAQAVAARGTILSQVGVRHLADPYHLCDDQHCQVYKGTHYENEPTTQAVDKTKGTVLVYGKRMVETYYSSNCGGFTEHNENVWSMKAKEYLRGHADSIDNKNAPKSLSNDEEALKNFLNEEPQSFCKTDNYKSGKYFRWTKTLSAKEADELIKKRFDIGRLKNIKILERGVSGRIVKLKLIGKKSEMIVERELPVRRLFGGLRSALFVLLIERDDKGWPTTLQFKGGGFGHGVGMCQTGSMEMGHQNFSFSEILNHYYPNSELITIW